jgi:hypothetical protein
MNLRELITKFGSVSKQMEKRAKFALFSEGSSLLSEFKDRSPVDTGSYKSRWQLSRDRFGTAKSIASVSIFNNSPQAEPVEYGAEIGKNPWNYNPNAKKRTGKLKVSDGRVWAGGLNPGHSTTVGGAIGKGLFNNKRRMDKLVKSIADSVMEAF